jgi:hypothetical protein
MAVGGSIESVSIRGRNFPVASDADVTRKLGGFENEVQANGDGSARNIKTRVPWALSGLQIEVDENRADQQFLQEIADNNEFVDMSITYASGSTYQGTGTITDELAFSSQSATASVSLMGRGNLTQQ